MELALPFVSPNLLFSISFPLRVDPYVRGLRDASLSDFLRFYRDATRALDDKLDRSRRENFDERVSAFSDRFHARDGRIMV